VLTALGVLFSIVCIVLLLPMILREPAPNEGDVVGVRQRV
jgi:hypothetical protein